MRGFPVIGRNHLNCIPRASVEKSAFRPLAYAFLATDAKVRVYLYAAKGRMVFIWNPEHACFDRTILNAGRGTCTASATIRSNGKYPRPLLPRRLAVSFGHRPVLFDYLNHGLISCNPSVIDESGYTLTRRQPRAQ